jgi:precorrin-2 dehydrogenase/sirohydrochlorin ferrochelatase
MTHFFRVIWCASRRTTSKPHADFSAHGCEAIAVREELALLPDDAPALFPVFLKLANRHCLAVGGGKVAEPRIETLLAAKANVLVIAPKVTSSIHQWAKEKKLVWEERPFELHDLDGMGLVVCATSSAATNRAVFEESQNRGVLCNVADEPELSDFYFPTVMRRGALQIAISTAGNSPALEQRIAEELRRFYGPEYEGWLEWLGKARASIFADPLSPRRRKTLLRKLASERGLEEFLRRRGMTTAEENR